MLNGTNSDAFLEWGRLAMTRDYIADSGPGDITSEPPHLAPSAERLQMLLEFVDAHEKAWNQNAKERTLLSSAKDANPNLVGSACVKACYEEYSAVLRDVPQAFFSEFFLPESLMDSNPCFSPERLQANLDQVEMCLLNHVQNRTEFFFSTMHMLHGLYIETDKMIKDIHSARKKIRVLMKKTVLPHFRLISCRRRQNRLLHSRNKLRFLAEADRSFTSIQFSIDSSHFKSAVNMIMQTRRVILQEQLDSLACGRLLNDRLHALEEHLSEALTSSLARVIYKMQCEPFYSTDAKSLLETWLHLQASTEGLIDQLSIPMQTVSKNIIADGISKAVADTDSEKCLILCSPQGSCPEPSLIKAICSLSELQFTDLLLQLYAALDTFFDKLSSFCSLPDSLDQTDHLVALSRQLGNAFRSATESSHARCARIIAVRKKDEPEISLSTVCLRLQAGLDFVRKDEERCGTSFLAIRQLLAQQARKCLSQHHAMFIKQIIHSLDYDEWRPTNAEKRFQKMIDRKFCILINDTSSRQENESELWSLPDWNENVSSSSSEDDRASPPTVKLPYLVVNDQRFRVTTSLLELMSNIQETLMIAHMLPKEICPSGLVCVQVCTMLRNYNSRSHQLILGAAATNLLDSKLKQITAKMLCLLSQNIGLLLAILPLLKAAVTDLVAAKTRVITQIMQFDQIGRDLGDHRQHIFTKIISIMDVVITETSDYLLETGITSPDNLEKSLAKLMERTRSLHRFVSSILPPRQVNQLFTEISKHIGSGIASSLEKIELPREQICTVLADIRLQLVNIGIRVDHVAAFSDVDDCNLTGDFKDSKLKKQNPSFGLLIQNERMWLSSTTRAVCPIPVRQRFHKQPLIKFGPEN